MKSALNLSEMLDDFHPYMRAGIISKFRDYLDQHFRVARLEASHETDEVLKKLWFDITGEQL
jgi:hypothetical protein